MGEYLRVRIPKDLKNRLKHIASNRAAGPGQRSVTVSDVAREYLIRATEQAA
jgi:predicted transcriptional regulator